MAARESVDDARGRSTRPKEKKSYITDGLPDDEIDGKYNFSVEEKLVSTKFSDLPKFYIELSGSDLRLSYFQKNGFSTPLLVKDKTGLGMRMPSDSFSVSDVKRCVGSRRVLDVMDVNSQKGLEMTVKEWVKYYEDVEEHHHRLLNVISLEFSHTRLEDYVDQPEVVHDMDWIDLAWPWYYKELQTQSTNALDSMMYPKVQKYCLMSVGGCYTDFHIDMGGTSVWYHVLKGQKVFWLIPPSEENLSLYVSWTLSSRQNDVFFGDMVKDCYRITLEAGWTFFIPTGWIHAVYTPKDSLVFGGNFLHCFNMALQLQIADVEVKTHVPTKFRYPLFKELHWYVLERYVSCVTGKDHRTCSQAELSATGTGDMDEADNAGKTTSETDSVKLAIGLSDPSTKHTSVLDAGDDDGVSLSMVCDEEEITTATNGILSMPAASKPGPRAKPKCLDAGKLLQVGKESVRKVKSVYLSRWELDGLEAVVTWLEGLPVGKRNVPKDVLEPDELLSDVRAMLKQHSRDNPELAVTGMPVLEWPPRKMPKRRKSKTSGSGASSQSKAGKSTAAPVVCSSEKATRRRRVRCRQCEPCTREDCRECTYCLDMKKYGGSQTMKKPCISRNCLAPMLSREAVCEICRKGDVNHDWSADVGDDDEDWSQWLMECRICYQLVHPACLSTSSPDLTHSGTVDEDFPSSWDCACCCSQGLQGQNRPRSNQLRVNKTQKSQAAGRSVSPAKLSSVKADKSPPEPQQPTCQQSLQEKEVGGTSSVTAATAPAASSRPLDNRHFTDAIVRLSPVHMKKPKVEVADVCATSSDETSAAKLTSQKSSSPHRSRSSSSSPRVKRKHARKPSRELSPEPRLSTVYQVNSRGREISLPRRYLL